MTQKRVLPAVVFDALEFSALAFGGVGAGRWFSRDEGDNPCCIVGHTMAASDSGLCINNAMQKADRTRWLSSAETDSDSAVRSINRRKGIADEDARVSFADWCKELGVERGT